MITPDEGVEEGQEPASPHPANDDTGKLLQLQRVVIGVLLHSHSLEQAAF